MTSTNTTAGADHGTIETTERSGRWLALAVVCVGTMLAFVNVSSTIGALASIQADLRATSTQVLWITSAYSLVVAGLVLGAGTLGDLVGRRLLFMAGVGFFIGGSVTAFMAGAAGVLVAAQVGMGVGGAMVLPTSLAVISHAFTDPQERTEAISVWAGSSGVGLAVGPLGAGLLLDSFSWHSIYLINVVLGALALVGALAFVTESKHPTRTLDPVGMALGTLSVAALTYAVIEGKSQGYTSGRLLLVYAVFTVSMAAFIAYEARHHDPMIDLRLFRSGSFSAGLAVATVAMFGFVGAALLTTLYLQHVHGLTPLQTGVRLLVMFIPFIVVSALAGRLVRRTGFKVMLTCGLLVTAIGILTLCASQATPDFSYVWPGLLLVGIGSGLLIAPSTAAAIISVDPSQAGMASSTVNMFRQLGNVLGASVLGTILTSQFAGNLSRDLREQGLSPKVVSQVIGGTDRGSSAASIPPGLVEQVSHAANTAFTAAYHSGLLVGVIVVATTAIPTALLVRHRPAA